MQKTCNNVATNYVLHGNNVVHLTHGSNTLHFFYDAQNSPAVVEYNGVSYGYVKNLQGDIIAIVNASSTKVVEYVYDAWGKLLGKTGSMASTLGTLNPFRYRGYVYDEETELYYLRSRYYNPNWCRFVNADALAVSNLFNYCSNNPISKTDHSGALEDDEDWSLMDYFPELFVETSVKPGLQIDDTSYFRTTIMPRIASFIENKNDYKYNINTYIQPTYRNGVNVKAGEIACAHLMYIVTGKVGSITAPYRYSECKGLGIEHGSLFDRDGNLMVELVEGMEVYKTVGGVENGHVGMLVLHDFGNGRGYEWAVFQSASLPVTLVDALFENDNGPNITAFYDSNGISKWENYTAPRF